MVRRLPSPAAWRIAVIGRQKEYFALSAQTVIPVSAPAK